MTSLPQNLPVGAPHRTEAPQLPGGQSIAPKRPMPAGAFSGARPHGWWILPCAVLGLIFWTSLIFLIDPLDALNEPHPDCMTERC